MTYSSAVAAGRTRSVGRNKNSVSFRPSDSRLGPVSNTIILIVLACLVGLLYLTQVTKTNSYGYEINELEKEQTSLRLQHDNLSATSARIQQVERVQASAEAKEMVATAPTTSVQ